MPPPWTDARPQLKPISAFSFSLATHSPRRTPDRTTPADVKPKREPSATPLRLLHDARPSHTPSDADNADGSSSVMALSVAPVYPSPGPLPGVDYEGIVTPSRRTVFKRLETVPVSPFFIQPRTPIAPAERDVTPGRPTQLKSLLDLTPIKQTDKSARHDPDPTHRALGELPAHNVAEMLSKVPSKRRLDEDEIGVSPRGKRIIRWSGAGPPPVSVQLSQVLASASSSLQLFYTSYSSKLHPTPARQIAKTSFSSEGAAPMDLLRTAPLQLRLTEAVKGPTHHATLVWADVVSSNGRHRLGRPPPMLGVKPDPDAPMVDHSAGSRARVMIMFQCPPAECPRLGHDPRVAQQRMDDPQNRCGWEVGIWAPWSEIELALPPTKREPQDLTAREDISLQGVGKLGQHKVIVASRYIVVEKRL